MVLPASAMAVSDQIQSPTETAFTGGSGPGGRFLLDAGNQAQLLNNDPAPGAEHNVVAEADGPDGGRLFETDLIPAGPNPVPVRGTEYLTAGDYAFVCTIHFGMEGTLRVTGAGAVPRPAVSLQVVSSKLARVAKGKLKLAVEAGAASPGVSVVARVGKRTLPAVEGVDLAAGERRKLTLRLDRAARTSLEGAKRAKVTLRAEVPYGAPASARRTLR